MKINRLYQLLSNRVLMQNSTYNNARLLNKNIKSQDTIELSLSAHQLNANRKVLDSLTHLKGNAIRELKANGNILDIQEGSYYRFEMNGFSTLLSGGSSGYVGLPSSELSEALGTETILSIQEHKKSLRIERFFSSLAGSPAGLIGSWEKYTGAETLSILKSVGIEPGWFTIKGGAKPNTFYLTETGIVHPKYDMEASRRALNKENLFEIGYTAGEIITVDGKDFTVDETGHVHIPDDVPVFHNFYSGNIDKTYHERSRNSLLEKYNMK
ncbi:hypothetical protein [Sporosarcina limicola]|uniref:Uncharacterized protein n=1 Tax=Sporosarcina limicola TaxID=34101 RepID=A0A927MN83_9BACL|nr:hypothetical protein [Sporosarcina limicola]MBE1555987.1 hypothetical protein [Sporosarcina limicola]